MVFKETTVGKMFGHTESQKLVGRCMRYDSDITIEMGSKKINAKSLMGVVSLGLKRGNSVTVITKGDDQEEALEAVIKLLSAGV